jgi:Mg2+ and Co2+ transporter CorA
LPQVLATPVMILIMENAALNSVRPFLDAGESAVGTAVDVKHFTATPIGHEVRATAEVVNVEGRRVDFAAHLYRNGKNAKAVSLDEPIDCKGKSEFAWIGLFEPSERELEQLEKNYGLHPLAIEDALKANQLPKVDVYGDQLFVMTRTAHLEDDHIAYGETAIFVGKNFITTVRHGSARAHSDLRPTRSGT